MNQEDHNEYIELGIIDSSSNGAVEHSCCSFCGRSASEVNCLLAGADALICDDCVARYKAQLRDEL